MNGRILVMDDDESICRIFVLMLGRLGYEVVTVSTGEAAVQQFTEAKAGGKPFSAVILDLTVREGIGGVETLHAMKAVDPEVRAVCASGQSREASIDSYAQQGFKAVLPKPFRYQDVVDCVTKLLGPAAGH